MNLEFDKSGNLRKDVQLSFEEFLKYFGKNIVRKAIIKNALIFFKLFSSCGCTTVYIGGSFASTKRKPNDIDLLFDLRSVEEEKLYKVLPEFFGPGKFKKITEIRRTLKCHVFIFDVYNNELLELLQKDKNGNPRGLIKISLTEGYDYDQKRKTI